MCWSLRAALAMTRGAAGPGHNEGRVPSAALWWGTPRPILLPVMSSEARQLQQPMVTGTNHFQRREPASKLARCAPQGHGRRYAKGQRARQCVGACRPLRSQGHDAARRRLVITRERYHPPRFGGARRTPSFYLSCRAKRDSFNNQWSPVLIISSAVNRLASLLAALARTRETLAKGRSTTVCWSLRAALARTREAAGPGHNEGRVPSAALWWGTPHPILLPVMSSEARQLQQPMVTGTNHFQRREPASKLARCARKDTRDVSKRQEHDSVLELARCARKDTGDVVKSQRSLPTCNLTHANHG